MLELRLKLSELRTFENPSQNVYNHNLKKQINRIIKSIYTTYLNQTDFKQSEIKGLEEKWKTQNSSFL